MSQGLTLAFSTRTRGPHIARYIRHLRRTCGVPNSQILYRVNPGRWSLSELYNQFLAEAAYSVVCLLHDDLRFARNAGWGRRLLQSFARWPEYAVLGPAGGVAVEEHGIYWLTSSDMAGEVRHRIGGKTQPNPYSAPSAEPLEVLVLDGLLLAVHKDRIRSRFDERLRGFHFYDVAFSLAQGLAQPGGKCAALTGLGVTHLSGGNNNHLFFEQRDAFIGLYSSILPRRLRPDLRLRPLPLPGKQDLKVLVVIRWSDERLGIAGLVRSLRRSAYRRSELLVLNGTGQPLPPRVAGLAATGSWAKLNSTLIGCLRASKADLVLFLDHRVQPLQDWLPTMVSDFQVHSRLGTLGVRLHYPDTHLVAHNGLEIFRHPDGRPDVAIRGIHTPYPYRNALEWVPAGSHAQALMLRRELFLTLGGFAGQSWLPGLELNLLAAAAGWRNAVDSRLAGYLLDEDAGSEAEYQAFLRDFAPWYQLHDRRI